MATKTCGTCNGVKYVDGKICTTCNGAGIVWTDPPPPPEPPKK